MIWQRNLQLCDCFCRRQLTFHCCQPNTLWKIAYVDVPIVPCKLLLPIFIHTYFNLIVLEYNVPFDFLSFWFHKQTWNSPQNVFNVPTIRNQIAICQLTYVRKTSRRESTHIPTRLFTDNPHKVCRPGFQRAQW